MSSTILHSSSSSIGAVSHHAGARAQQEHLFLAGLGRRVRTLRQHRGLTRKALACATGVSERHLANLEQGTGNASVVVLLQVAHALGESLSALLAGDDRVAPEGLAM